MADEPTTATLELEDRPVTTAQPRPLRPVSQMVDAPPSTPKTRAEEFGRRMFEFAGMMMLDKADGKSFADLMFSIADDFARGMTDAEFFDRMQAATDLLPMTKARGLEFSSKIHTLLKNMNGETEESSTD